MGGISWESRLLFSVTSIPGTGLPANIRAVSCRGELNLNKISVAHLIYAISIFMSTISKDFMYNHRRLAWAGDMAS